MNAYNKTLFNLVKTLHDQVCHDGNELGRKLHVSRSAIWKTIKKLKQYGLPIESVQRKGYRLREPIVLLDAEIIDLGLKDPDVAVVLYEQVSSTNHCARAYPQARLEVCLAELQTDGKGRLGRKWHSPFGKNIYCTCFYRFEKDMTELAGLGLVTGLAIYQTLKDMGIDDALSLKWPNDVMYRGKKLAGTLIEVEAEAHGICDARVGIGINVNMTDASAITQPWISMHDILKRSIDRNALCIKLIKHLRKYLAQFETHGFKYFIDSWQKCDHFMQREVVLNQMQQAFHGKVVGINQQGHLLLEFKNGEIRAFSSGDTSIQKPNAEG